MISVVSILLQEFYNSNDDPSTILATSKILITLLRNALKSSSSASAAAAAGGSNSRNTIRLSNPKIQKHVVNVSGALDILCAAGFEEQIVDVNGVGVGGGGGSGEQERRLTYIPPTSASTSDGVGEHDSHSNDNEMKERRALIESICDGLEAKIAELSPPAAAAGGGGEAGGKHVADNASASESKSNGDNPFLSTKERQRRYQKLKADKRAKIEQRKLAKERWNEDMEEKRLAAQQREAALSKMLNVSNTTTNNAIESRDNGNKDGGNGGFDGLAMGVTIASIYSRKRGGGVLPKPFEDQQSPFNNTSAKIDTSTVLSNKTTMDPPAIRRQLIQQTMKDNACSAKEKQSKIRQYMGMDDASLLALVSASAASSGSTVPADSAMALKSDHDEKLISGGNSGMANDSVKDEAMMVTDDRKQPPVFAGAAASTAMAHSAKGPCQMQQESTMIDGGMAKARAHTPPSSQWTSFIQNTPRCAGAEGIRDASVFFKNNNSSAVMDMGAPPKCLKRLFKELDGLRDSLPSEKNCSIWLRFDEETPQYIRALITAPLPGPTPYSGGIFFFDIYIPNEYPNTNPHVKLLTTGGGRVRFGPNLYADGKVCLSLLGTWEGPRWNPKHSSLYQVLISIQGLILGVEHPYYLEPGHGGWEGTVKEGDFQKTGQTLTGKKVKEEMGVPMQVILYEDVLRVGTVRYAMSQPLRSALDCISSAASSMGSTAMRNTDGMEAFADIVQAHFCENKSSILAEVRNWMSDSALGRDRTKMQSMRTNRRLGAAVSNAGGGGSVSTLQIDALQGLVPKLEGLLSKAVIPDFSGRKVENTPKDVMAATTSAVCNSTMMEVEEYSKPAAREPSNDKEGQSDAIAKQNEASSSSGANILEQKRQQMQQAAQQGDLIRAGKLQESVNRLEELQRGMQEAAKQGDYIRARRLQSQFNALTENQGAAKAPTGNTGQQPSIPLWSNNTNNEHNSEDDDSEEMSWNEDDGMDEDEGGFPFHGGSTQTHHHGIGSNVFAPPGYHSHMVSNKHSWGDGRTLSAAPAPSQPSATIVVIVVESDKKAAPKKSIHPDQLCRLRIRAQDKSVVEDFDKNDTLSCVYHRLESLMPGKREDKNRFPDPTVPGGTFSQPVSSAGFTLLLTRPKREFSLEMHGTKSLMELNLAPSATLTVMMCSERGIMYRGELESRLRSAQGDAIDVEGLTYEGLMELTERVGKAAPKEGSEFLNLTNEEFEASTEQLSAALYMSKHMEEEDHRCPICLGGYDKFDNTPSLRKIKNCQHTMHLGCLLTWLRTNSSCPLCKVHLIEESE